MNTNISIGDSLVVTFFSITMVFFVLIIISIFIAMLKNIGRKAAEPAKVKTKDKSTVEKIGTLDEKAEIKKGTIDQELVAVISAAIAASLDIGVEQVNVKSIKRLNDSSPIWSTAGRQDQMENRV